MNDEFSHICKLHEFMMMKHFLNRYGSIATETSNFRTAMEMCHVGGYVGRGGDFVDLLDPVEYL